MAAKCKMCNKIVECVGEGLFSEGDNPWEQGGSGRNYSTKYSGLAEAAESDMQSMYN